MPLGLGDAGPRRPVRPGPTAHPILRSPRHREAGHPRRATDGPTPGGGAVPGVGHAGVAAERLPVGPVLLRRPVRPYVPRGDELVRPAPDRGRRLPDHLPGAAPAPGPRPPGRQLRPGTATRGARVVQASARVHVTPLVLTGTVVTYDDALPIVRGG